MKPVFTGKNQVIASAKCLWETRIDPISSLPSHLIWQDLRANWGDDDSIWFSGGGSDYADARVYQVAAAGGDPHPVTPPGDTDPLIGHHPHPLPGGRAVLLTVTRANGSIPTVVVYERDTGTLTTLADGGAPWYASSGHVVFSLEDTLWAFPFDLDRLRRTGEPVPVLPGVRGSGRPQGILNWDRGTQVFVSEDGTLLYRLASGAPDARTLVWVDRDGTETDTGLPARAYLSPRLSPDGARVVVSIAENSIWVYDLATRVPTQLTASPRGAHLPLWTPDGTRVLFTSFREGDDGVLDIWEAGRVNDFETT